ncbi:M3 family metallopeptidase [Methylocapsa palsarum]|uniref:Peptidyl-dipeptidase Dcp n=1 Tax=Methylocapsa palsarum TaxID=1612308 RepID=A0A1I3XJU0_9HYPH|nr:M3 family metallopeptidase [Methylocapsa palsarum]SFK19775.1 peptidyl-dipeptidase Dcp [Methylocapsa palsarum]
MTHEAEGANPLLEPWGGPFEAPPFERLSVTHFRPAFEAALGEARAEIAAIAANSGAPTFTNTIEALERGGRTLDKVANVFFNLAGADSSPEIEAIEREIAPVLARHRNEIYLNAALYQRIAGLYEARETLGLDPEQARVLERYHVAFSRAGAGLPDAARTRLAEIGERLAVLGAQFGQNVLADEKAYTLVLEAADDLAGLPDWLVAAAARAAEDRGLAGKHVITLGRSSIEPFLQYSARRDLREKAFRAWAARGEQEGPTDNRAVASEIVRLRGERARLLGFESFAHYRLADTMAKTPQAARDLLDSVWTPALAQAAREEAALQAMIAEEGGNFKVAPWDWRYYAEKRRKAEFDLDENATKPYLQLDKMIEAAFYAANRLFGLTFAERRDIPLHHPDARSFTVFERNGAPVALFIGDYFARPSKHSGAWMNAFRVQEKLDGEVLPIVVNVLNFARAGEGSPSLLSFDDARTLFHEFGHALHGMLSNVTYPLLSGTNVSTDFVEFPSQVYENWLEQPEMLRRFARHYVTDEPMPEPLLEKLLLARRFNQGFATIEYTASALVDLDLHLTVPEDEVDVVAFEKKRLEQLGMPEAIIMRHRTPHFQHIFSGGGYAAGYYSYLWSEVLDADGFEAFAESGDIFQPQLAEKLHDHVYSAGNTRDPEAAYIGFRGRAPEPKALLLKRGLVDADSEEAK